MSMIASSSIALLLLLLLCSCLHACNARGFGVEPANINNVKENDEKLMNGGGGRVLMDPETKSSTTNGNEEGRRRPEKAIDSESDNEPMKHNIPAKGKYSNSKNNNNKSDDEGVVSWKVPEKKRGEQEPVPGFNLDYLPPRTHPPVHN